MDEQQTPQRVLEANALVHQTRENERESERRRRQQEGLAEQRDPAGFGDINPFRKPKEDEGTSLEEALAGLERRLAAPEDVARWEAAQERDRRAELLSLSRASDSLSANGMDA